MNMEDLFPEFAPISTSQEELLQRNRFEIENPFREITSTYNHHRDHPEVILPDHHINIASSSTNPIISLSGPDFQVDIQGFVRAPSFVSLDNVDVANCSFNTEDDETLDLMDFGNYSGLGFSENSTRVESDDHAEMDCDDDLGEPPHKKMKSLEMNGEDDVDSVNNYNDSYVEIPTRNDKGKKVSVFDALRFLANAKKIEDENEDHTLLEIAMCNGVTLPHPSWRPKPEGH